MPERILETISASPRQGGRVERSATSRTAASVVLCLAGLYFICWGATQWLGTAQVRNVLAARGSTVGKFAYSPAPFLVRVDETFTNPMAGSVQRADTRYGWFFGHVAAIGAVYVSLPDDPYFK